jgi:hypothetical protein
MTSDGTNTYSYDAANRLIQVAYPGDGNYSSFVYDAFDRNVMIQEYAEGALTSSKQFIWTSRRSECRDGAGNVLNQYFAFGQTDEDNSFYYTKDQLGSVRQMTDVSDNIQATYEYDPFGQQSVNQNTLESDFGFSGYYKHGTSGLCLTHFRAYNRVRSTTCWRVKTEAS